MRFQVLLKKENVPGMSFFPFFETNDIQEAMAFTNLSNKFLWILPFPTPAWTIPW